MANQLWKLSGQPVSVHSDKKDKLIIDCVPSIPDDFAPCLILDASARLKATYELQDEARNDIIHLPYINKSYRNLEVNVWARKSGKQIIKDIKDVIPELLSLLSERQGEDFLIILHKDHKEIISKALSRQLTSKEMTRVNYCTWARHTATNDYSNISNIIMLSPYQFPDYAYEAITRASTILRTADGSPEKGYMQRVKKGEISSNILQAVNRGIVRKSEDDTCPPCRLWLIAHPNTGIASVLQNIFPHCKVTPWKVDAVNLSSGKQRKTFAYLQALIKQGGTEVTVKTVREYLEFKGSASHFTRDVINQSAFSDAITKIGWKCAFIGRSYIFSRFSPVEAI